MSTSKCFSHGEIHPRGKVCGSSFTLAPLREECPTATCSGEGISPILVGIITALVTALITGLIVMAMMKFACNDTNRVEDGSGAKREA